MVAENTVPPISLNRLLFRTFKGSIIMFSLICLWEYFADPDPIDAGTFIFMGMVLVMCLGVAMAIYKLRLQFVLETYPATVANILGLVVFYIFLFMKQPFILFGVELVIMSILGLYLVMQGKEEKE